MNWLRHLLRFTPPVREEDTRINDLVALMDRKLDRHSDTVTELNERVEALEKHTGLAGALEDIAERLRG